MTTWPVGLPQNPQANGYSQEFPEPLKSQIDGVLQQRSKSTCQPVAVDCTVIVEVAEKAILDAFYDSQCVLPFEWTDHLTGETANYRIMEPPVYSCQGGTVFDAKLKLEIVK